MARFAVGCRAALAVALLAGCPHQGLEVDLAIPEAEERVELGGPLEVLGHAAADLDPGPRARALDLLVRSSDEPAGGPWGQRGLYDPNPWVQTRVVDALAYRLPERQSVEALESLVRRSEVEPYVRGAAGLKLARAGHTGTLPVLSEAWRAETESWRRAPLAAAALAMGDEQALEPLSAVLISGDLPLEVEFVLELGRGGLVELVPALRKGQGNVEEELALPYAAARVSLGDSAGEGALRRALGASDEQWRLEALDYLSVLDEPAATALLRRARGNESDLVSWYARLALCARGDENAERLVEGFASDDLEIKELALRFAGEAGRRELSRKDEKAARDVLRAGLEADEALLKETALRGLLELGLDGEEELLRHHLGSEFIVVRIEAAGTLLLLERG